ncbi:NAD(P)/FAD-dependent oxidoreductase [Aquabacterium sp.]|uniref:NAD(P)/FAD-dependent oxidoreductase n=1 Tax=Aquabacterium sp. TaxID=1872578 RepID=UPI003D6CA1AB
MERQDRQAGSTDPLIVAVIDTDTLVIGAGPVGLFQAFQLGLLGLNTHVIDALPEAGGQCVALYPDKPIYDVPGVPVCTGRELAQLLLTQARPFLPRDATTGRIGNLHLNDQVASITQLADGEFDVGTRQGQGFRCRAVFVAAGAGAFVPRTLNVAALEGMGNVHHHLPEPLDRASSPWAGQHLVVAGGGEEALSTVAALMNAPQDARPATVTLLHRRDQFQAEPALEAKVRAWIAQGAVQLALGVPSGADLHSDGQAVSALQILGADGAVRALPLDHLLVRLGLSPKLGPLVDWGLQLDRKQVRVSADSFQSSVTGIYAVGDINTYPGKKRLLLCGFHEATLAAHHALAQLKPDQPQHLQYTTTSALLHQRLGVA